MMIGSRAALAGVVVGLIAAASSVGELSAAIIADSASDICGATIDPCNITQTVTVVSGSTLDFGTRTVQVSGSGLIDVGAGDAQIRAGRMTVQVSGTGLKLSDGAFGGFLTIESYRVCSLNGAVRCLSDATCADAGAGTCSVGSGEVDLQAKTVGSAEFPGALFVRAGGDVRIGQRIQVNGNTLASDGGTVDVDARGSVFVDGPIEANSGGDGTGGEVVLRARTDLFVRSTVDAQGGDFDGGSIELRAGRDVLVTAGVSADSSSGAGFGGSLSVSAGRNIEVTGGTATSNLLMTTEGHTGYDDAVAEAGDGGFQYYTAGSSISIGQYVRFRANGAIPDGAADDITIRADGPLTIQGVIEARARGTLGEGGLVDITGGDTVTLASSSILDARGGEYGGGELSITARGDLTSAGALDVSGSSGGLGGLLELAAERALILSGKATNAGVADGGVVGEFVFHGCRIDVLGGATIQNLSAAARTTFYVADRMRVLAGASVRAPSGGKNRAYYRDATVPPQVQGSVVPALTSALDVTLPTCPLCGNGAVNLGETCDDGNLTGGDGCSVDCQDEGCIAQTPTYPSVPLCFDGNPCTADRCDAVEGVCTHVASCDDGFACTIDQCIGGVCVHAPLDAVCEDNNACTSQSCDQTSGCHVTAIAGPCDDDVYCNGADSCLAGVCALHSGDPCAGAKECLNVCDEIVDNCRAPFGYPCSTDGNVCTDDVCSGAGGCLHIANSAPCDNGVFCDGADFCVSGHCSYSVGSRCDATAECAIVCDEAADICADDAGEPCADDDNQCTDDYCDGLGHCAHVANSTPCDDGDFCTTTDVCAGGQCVATDRVDLPVARITATRRSGVADDRIAIKASAPLSSLAESPTTAGVSLALRRADGSELFSGHLPGEGIVDSGGGGVTFKFRDSQGVYPTANGVVSATIKRVVSKGVVRINVKARGLDFSPFIGIDSTALSVLVGADPSTGDCLSARTVACSSSITTLRCAN